MLGSVVQCPAGDLPPSICPGRAFPIEAGRRGFHLALTFGFISDEVLTDNRRRFGLLSRNVLIVTLIFGTGLTYEPVAKKAGNIAYRAAVGAALAAALILLWLNLAVGVIGTEDDLANLMYVGVLAVGIVGAIIARFRPYGMTCALFTTALAQALVAVITGLGSPWSGPVELLALNGFFVALFGGTALLFRYAAREQTPAGAGPEG